MGFSFELMREFRKTSHSKWMGCVDMNSWLCVHSLYPVTISRFLKLWVSFADYRLFYRAVLQKRPSILRSLLIVATQYEFLVVSEVFASEYQVIFWPPVRNPARGEWETGCSTLKHCSKLKYL